MTISPYSITTLDETKQFLGILASDTSKDGAIEALIDAVSENLENITGRQIITRQITAEPHEGEGYYIQLDHYPVSQITALKENGTTVPDDEYILIGDSGLLYREDGWGETIIVSYNAGYGLTTADAPKTLKLACWKWIAALLQKQNPNLKEERLGDYTAVFSDTEGIPSEITALVEPYRQATV